MIAEDRTVFEALAFGLAGLFVIGVAVALIGRRRSGEADPDSLRGGER